MNRRLTDILRDLPPGLTEADIVDMVDGEVPPHREALVIDALQERPMLGLLVKQMRADRGHTQVLADLTGAAPTNLLEGIQAKLDRDALAELVHEAEEASAAIPISQAPRVGGHGGVIRVLAESVWARRLATAASLAIVAGLGALGVRELSRRWPGLPNVVVVQPPAPADPSSASPIEVVTGKDTPAIDPGAENLANPPAAIATSEQPTVESTPLTASAALALARDGRLVITVHSGRVADTLRQLEGLSRSAAADVRWRAFEVGRLPVELASLSTPRTLAPADAGGRLESKPAVFASESSASTMVGPMPAAVADAPRPVVKAVHVVRMGADVTRLGDLLKDLNITRDQVAEFHVLPAPIAHGPSIEPESVLWWSAGGESWTPRIVVPIIIETIE